MNTLDLVIYASAIVLAVTFVFIIIKYIKGLKGTPYELYLVFIAKVIEYVAYGSINMAFVLFLSSDVGLSDMQAASFITVWSLSLSIVTMMSGPIADSVGIRKTLLAGAALLVFARIIMPLSTNIYLITALGFIPLGIGMSLVGPVLSVAIKRFTSKETAALGFGLFYTLMNVGWAGGAWVFDFFRIHLGETTKNVIIPGVLTMSTYQVIFAVSFFCSILNFIILYFMREGVEFSDEENRVVIKENLYKQPAGQSIFTSFIKVGVRAFNDSVVIIKNVMKEKPFWVFMGMLSILIFVKMTFYHFHYTYPKYAIRILGEGIKIGAIFGVLNPVMIIFLTPLVATLTRKIPSYKVLVFGTFISSLSMFVAAMPEKLFAPLMNTWVGELVLVRWLEVPVAQHTPIILALVLMVIIFTIGESIWSPRLMQFTAEIAPKGKEGTYISLSYLPYFGAKFFIGPMSGWLVSTYTPEKAASYPNHHMLWVWIGVTAIISPIGLMIFKKAFTQKQI